jgi:ceramide glucosyltransferase
VPTIALVLLQLLAGLGIVYSLGAASIAGRWRGDRAASRADGPSVTILKPLHGAEPALTANLRSFLDQDYRAPVQMICGVRDGNDPAIDSVRALRDRHPVELCLDERRHGANGKISNLVNMLSLAGNELILLSDSDIAVERDYLARIAAALASPGVGAATCLYAGRGDAGGWSRLAAAGISYQFLPSVMIGLALGLARPCMGSTIALRRATLDRIGGFAPFADTLADDHAIGAAVRGLGLTVAVPAMLVTHGCAERSLGALVRHELRWNATVSRLDPLGFAGSIVTHPFPLALLTLFGGGGVPAFLVLSALLARLALAMRIDAVAGRRTAPLWLLPFRDVLSFGIFVATFFVRSIDWRGERFTISRDGRMSADMESVP